MSQLLKAGQTDLVINYSKVRFTFTMCAIVEVNRNQSIQSKFVYVTDSISAENAPFFYSFQVQNQGIITFVFLDILGFKEKTRLLMHHVVQLLFYYDFLTF